MRENTKLKAEGTMKDFQGGLHQDMIAGVGRERGLQLQQKMGIGEGGEHHSFSFSHHRAIAPQNLGVPRYEHDSQTTSMSPAAAAESDNWPASRRIPSKIAVF